MYPKPPVVMPLAKVRAVAGLVDVGADSDLWKSANEAFNQRVAANDSLSYKARPLDGIWATAPYLHNGSVPSLWWMLTPQAERPKQFCMGFRDFDPQQVGFRVEANETPHCKSGETLFSTTNPDGSPRHGNSNLGHSLEAKPGEGAHEHKNGVIGRLLSDDERLNLIEYLKTL